MKTTTPDGVSLHIRQQGAGPEPVLFVHGSFATSRWWMPASALLPPAAFTTYLVDLRGCGDSDRPDDPAGYHVDQQARDIAAVIETLDLAGVHLVGHSLGAAIALTYAAQHAHRLRSLTLVSTPSPDGTPTPPEGYELLARMRDDPGLLAQALAAVMPARPTLCSSNWWRTLPTRPRSRSLRPPGRWRTGGWRASCGHVCGCQCC